MAKKSPKPRQPTVYYLIITLTAALLCFGLVMIASASSMIAYQEYDDSFFFLWRQTVYGVFGVAAMAAAAGARREWFKKLGPPLLVAAVLALLAVPILGEEVGGAKRWLAFSFFKFQPSELAKLAVILFAAELLSRKRKGAESLAGLMKPLGIPVMIIAGLIMIQPDLGTTIIILLSVFAMLYLANIRLRELLALAGVGLAGIAALISVDPERMSRVTIFRNPWADPKAEGYQLVQSLMALGSGGWTGVGLGLSRQKFGYLPAPYTDFIFAIIGEELGLLGTLSVVVLFLMFALAVITVIRRSEDAFGRLVAGGIGAMIVGQAFINIGGVTSSMPMTGVPLPLISFGGTSLIQTMFCIGILLNLAKSKSRKQKGVRSEGTNLRGRNSRPRLSRAGAGRSA